MMEVIFIRGRILLKQKWVDCTDYLIKLFIHHHRDDRRDLRVTSQSLDSQKEQTDS